MYPFSSRRRQWHPTPVLLPGKSHGWRSLVGCSPWGCKESDVTEPLHFHFSLSCIGGGNGNPLQCSCLENPRDGGAWWAAVCGVAQSQTRRKWLSSSSSSSSSSTACGIILPQPWIQPGSWQWNHWVPTTGHQGILLNVFFLPLHFIYYYYFFYPFTLNPCASLKQKWVLCRQYIVSLAFCPSSYSVFLSAN